MAGPTPSFIELDAFIADWAALRLTDVHLAALQSQLAASPTAGDLVRGGDGLRKLRFAPAGVGRGKRGGVRVYYADLPGVGIVVLAAAYAKSDVDDIGQGKLAHLVASVAVVRNAFQTRDE